MEELDRSRGANDSASPAASTPAMKHLAVVFLGCLLLFSPGIVSFSARVIDLSALRVLRGDVPYRDFWTMYAPGSIYINALGLRLFGEQLIVSNTLGVLFSAAAVAAYYQVAYRLLPQLWALLTAAVFAVAFFHAPYHAGLTSYPGSILFIWLAADRVAAHAARGLRRDLIIAGCCLGMAIFFKHDLGGYASIAAAVAILVAPGSDKVRNVAMMAGAATVIVLIPLLALIAAGAGPEMWRDLVVWPLGDFKVVRPESFPLLPSLWKGSITNTIRGNTWWENLQLPLLFAIAAAPFLWRARHRITSEQARILVFALVMLPLVWTAAHVQANTHRVTLPALGILIGAAGLLGMRNLGASPARPWQVLTLAVVAVWMASLLPERVALLHATWFPNPRQVNLPHLAGIVVSGSEARELRGLAQAIARAAPPEAPMVMLAERNDVVIHAAGVPYWLTDRRWVTRHHELHPGITDTEPYQRQMLADIRSGIPPVVVLEHRFRRKGLDKWRRTFQQQGVPVGAMLLDDWLRREYLPGPRFGMYEVLQHR